jgi:hypothetical protein
VGNLTVSDLDLDKLDNHSEVMGFFADVLKDEVCREQFLSAVDAKDDAAILAMASKLGYDLNLESLHLGLRKIVNLIAPIAVVEK